MRSKFAVALIVGLFMNFAFLSASVKAEEYGKPSPSLSISIDKLVSVPGNSSQFVDNLTSSNARFKPGDSFFFKLKVKNTGEDTLNNVVVEDFLPGDIELVEGDTSIEAGDFDIDEEKEFTLKVRVKAQNQLPQDKGVFCEVNRVRASAEDMSDEDTAQFCIEKQVAGVPGVPVQPPQQIPQAGPEMGLLLLGANMGLLGAGIYLKKRS